MACGRPRMISSHPPLPTRMAPDPSSLWFASFTSRQRQCVVLWVLPLSCGEKGGIQSPSKVGPRQTACASQGARGFQRGRRCRPATLGTIGCHRILSATPACSHSVPAGGRARAGARPCLLPRLLSSLPPVPSSAMALLFFSPLNLMPHPSSRGLLPPFAAVVRHLQRTATTPALAITGGPPVNIKSSIGDARTKSTGATEWDLSCSHQGGSCGCYSASGLVSVDIFSVGVVYFP